MKDGEKRGKLSEKGGGKWADGRGGVGRKGAGEGKEAKKKEVDGGVERRRARVLLVHDVAD
mgnify:CR=1 FL=1